MEPHGNGNWQSPPATSTAAYPARLRPAGILRSLSSTEPRRAFKERGRRRVRGMEKVKFHFDPRCPWCYQTSRWAKQLESLGEIELDWGVFSLEVVNLEDGADPRALEPTGSPALRTAVVIERTHGSKAIGPFYTALGRRN